LKREATEIWRDLILEKKFSNVDAEIGTRRAVGSKNNEQ
jgi:hypothetical protein